MTLVDAQETKDWNLHTYSVEKKDPSKAGPLRLAQSSPTVQDVYCLFCLSSILAWRQFPRTFCIWYPVKSSESFGRPFLLNLHSLSARFNYGMHVTALSAIYLYANMESEKSVRPVN